MKHRFRFVLICISLIITSCANSDEYDITTTHPISDNLLQEKDSVFLTSNFESKLNQDYMDLIQLFNDIEVQYKVDTHDAYSNQLIGLIDDVAITTSGEMYILDSRQFTVHKFNTSGEYQGTIGRNGNGPGEFMNPQKIVTFADSLLLVSDATKIEIFNILTEPKYVKTVQINSGVNSMCTIGDTLFTFSNMFLHHRMNNKDESIYLIHAYDMYNFEHIHSFGEPYQSQYPDIVMRLSAGYIVCNEKSNTVSFLYQFLPVLHAYSAKTGELEWSIGFDDLNLPKVSTSLNEGRVRFRYSRNENFNDHFFEPITLEGSYILVQLSRLFQDENVENYYTSFIIDSKNGTGKFVSKELPHIITMTNSHIAIRDLYSDYFPTAKLMVIN